MFKQQQLTVYAKTIVNEVRSTCVIGSSTHERDNEKTQSAKEQYSWSTQSVVEARKLRDTLKPQTEMDVIKIKMAIANWTQSVLRLLQTEKNISAEEMKREIPKLDSEKIYNTNNIALLTFQLHADIVRVTRCGNCGEQAALAFILSLENNIDSVEYFTVTTRPHNFIVWNRPKDSDSENISTWKGAFILDPWDKDNKQGFYQVDRMTPAQRKNLLGDYRYAYPDLAFRIELYENIDGVRTAKPKIPVTLVDVYDYLIQRTQTINLSEHNKKIVCQELEQLKTSETMPLSPTLRPVLKSDIQEEINSFSTKQLKPRSTQTNCRDSFNLKNPDVLADDFYREKDYYESFFYTKVAFHAYQKTSEKDANKIKEYLEKLATFEKHAAIIFNLATAAFKKGEFETAKIGWQQALQMFNHFHQNSKSIAQCHSYLASSYRELYEYESAITHCEMALKIYELFDPNDQENINEVEKIQKKKCVCVEKLGTQTPSVPQFRA